LPSEQKSLQAAWRRPPGTADLSIANRACLKAGNPRLRTTLIQLAWLWLRHQPQSALALWFEKRVRRNGGRLKKTTIVALARKLLVALWRYVTAGEIPSPADALPAPSRIPGAQLWH